MSKASDENSEKLDELFEAVKNNDLDKVEELLAKGADVNIEGKHEDSDIDSDFISPLGLAAHKGYVEIIKALLRSPDIDINKKDSTDYTPLYLAVESGHLKAVEVLLATKKVDINAAYPECGYYTYLHNASAIGNTEIFKALIKYPGISVNAKTRNGDTALHLAVANRHLEVVKMLLSVPGILVNEKCMLLGYTPLHLAVYEGYYKMVEALLSHPDTDLNVQDLRFRTPLHISVRNGDLKLASLLLQGGCNANVKDDLGFTAAYCAAKEGKSEILKLIVRCVQDNGKDVNATRNK